MKLEISEPSARTAGGILIVDIDAVEEAHMLERMGFAEWKGSSWGSQFWAATGAGRLAVQ